MPFLLFFEISASLNFLSVSNLIEYVCKLNFQEKKSYLCGLSVRFKLPLKMKLDFTFSWQINMIKCIVTEIFSFRFNNKRVNKTVDLPLGFWQEIQWLLLYGNSRFPFSSVEESSFSCCTFYGADCFNETRMGCTVRLWFYEYAACSDVKKSNQWDVQIQAYIN